VCRRGAGVGVRSRLQCTETGAEQMAQSRKASRLQVVAQRRSRRRRRIALYIAAPCTIAAIVAAVVLSSQPGYSGFEVIGRQPAVVQVFLPG
jgi:hypothetical protein